MNKLWLRFQDPQLEEAFQQEKQRSLQDLIIKCMCYGGIITLIINIIESIVYKKFDNIYGKSSVLLIFFLTIIINRKIKKYTSSLLFCLNFVILILEYNIPPDYTKYESFLFGSNFMLVHGCAGVGINFFPSLISSLSYALFRLVFAYTNQGQLDGTSIFFTIFSALTYSLFIYKIEYQHRSAFLFKFKDNNWESLISKLLSKPCSILRFNIDTLLFSQISANSQSDYFSSEEVTRQFINQSELYKQDSSLSAYLYKLYTEYESQPLVKFIEFHIVIIFQCKKIKMKIVLQRFEEISFFLILESEDQELKSQKQNYKSYIQQISRNHLQQISIQSNILKKYLHSNNSQLIIKYRLSLYQYQILKQRKLFFSETLLNVSEFLSKFLSSLRQYYKLIFSIQDNIVQITSKQLWILFLLEIFKNANSETSITINLCIQQQNIKLLVSGLPKLNQSSLYQMCKQLLIEEHTQKLLNHCFIFNKQPICSYKNLKIKQCERKRNQSEIPQLNI